MAKSSIEILLTSGLSVFTPGDLALLWEIENPPYLKTKIHRLIAQRKLIHLRRGIYVLDRDYKPWEMANKLYRPSYVSLNSVLSESGAIFQYDSAVYSIARKPANIVIDKRQYVYRSINTGIFFRHTGIETKDHTSAATPERAFLDLLYLEPQATIDNPDVLSPKRVRDLLPLYHNRALDRRAASYVK